MKKRKRFFEPSLIDIRLPPFHQKDVTPVYDKTYIGVCSCAPYWGVFIIALSVFEWKDRRVTVRRCEVINVMFSTNKGSLIGVRERDATIKRTIIWIRSSIRMLLHASVAIM